MNYKEKIKSANPCRQNYLDSINDLVEKMHNCANVQRKTKVMRCIAQQETVRRELSEMLGWPLCESVRSPLSIESECLREEDGIRLSRVKFEIFSGFYFYGLFYEHIGKKLPLVIVQHGAMGTPEQCSGLLEEISTFNYNNVTERVLKRDVHIFVPQLLLWSQDRYDISYDRATIDAKLRQVGSSITALELYSLRCCLLHYSHTPYIDSNRIGMIGLSYGGFFTMMMMALDTTLKCGFSCCYYNDRRKFIFPDWSWKNSAELFMDSELALLSYPRRLWITIGKNDDCFKVDDGMNEYVRLREEMNLCGINDEWLSFSTFDGGHEFCKDDALLDDFFDYLRGEK